MYFFIVTTSFPDLTFGNERGITAQLYGKCRNCFQSYLFMPNCFGFFILSQNLLYFNYLLKNFTRCHTTTAMTLRFKLFMV